MHLYHDFVLQGRRLGVVYKGVLGLGLMMVHFHDDAALQGRRFKAVYKGVLGLRLIVVYFDFVMKVMRFRVV
jgi:hypothetical protein